MVRSIRSHRVAYHGILLRRLLYALDPGADGIGRLAVLLYDHASSGDAAGWQRGAPLRRSQSCWKLFYLIAALL